MSKSPELSGETFGRLEVVRRDGRTASGNLAWLCRCQCGQEVRVNTESLRSGHTRSCGCLVRDLLAKRNQASSTHGHTKNGDVSRTYVAWCRMKSRTCNPNYPQAHYYSGRGITICPRWRESFQAFCDDMGLSPGHGWSIDRIDNEKGYEPGNCRWATYTTQNRNRRSNRLLTYQGETLSLTEWAERFGLNRNTLKDRLNDCWELERALTTPTRAPRKKTPRT